MKAIISVFFVFSFYTSLSQPLPVIDLAGTSWEGNGELNKKLIYHFERDSVFNMVDKLAPNSSFAKTESDGVYVPQNARYAIVFTGDQILIDIYYQESPEIRARGIIKVISGNEIEIGMNSAGGGPRPSSNETATDIIKLKRIDNEKQINATPEL